MTTAYTSLLGLALPVTGELSGTWGDTVNNGITSLLDSAISGTTTLSADSDVTLTTTQGSSNTAREAILLWTAGGSATRTITAPAQSKIYTVINASSGTQSIILAGAGPTSGVTIAKGESALCAWNGSDFIKISNTAGPGTFTNLTVTGNTSLGDADTDTITQAASYVTGTQLKSAKTATNTLSLAAYDVDGAAYTNLITLTASNTPTLALTSTGVGTINNMSIGATTASTGAFTTLTSNGATTFTAGTASTTTGTGTLVITGGLGVSGRINAANFDGIVGANTAAAGSFTTLGATDVIKQTGNPSLATAGATEAFVAHNTGYGAVLYGQGTTYDVALLDRNTTPRLTVTTTAVAVTGTLSATGVVSGSNFSGSNAGFSVGPATDSYQTGIQIFGSGGGGSAYKVFTLANNTTVTTVTTTGLAVNGTLSATGDISTTASLVGELKTEISNGSANGFSSFSLKNTGGTAKQYTLSLGGSGTSYPGSFYIYDATATAIRLLLDTSGNFGVNQPSPSFKIDAIGSTTNGSGIVTTLRLKNGGTTLNDGAKILFTAGTSTDGAGIGSGGQALDSADLRFFTGGNNLRMTIDKSGNTGIGVYPKATWDSGSRALQVGSSGAIWERTSDNLLVLTANSWFNGAADLYIENGFASRMYQVDGTFTWNSAPSGSADTSISWDTGMALSRTGQLSLTTTQGVAQISNTISASFANGATLDFTNFSGMIIVSNWSTGNVGVFITGGGASALVSSIGAGYGTVTYPATFDGYRWTNTTGSTYTFSFTAIRYRPNA